MSLCLILIVYNLIINNPKQTFLYTIFIYLLSFVFQQSTLEICGATLPCIRGQRFIALVPRQRRACHQRILHRAFKRR